MGIWSDFLGTTASYFKLGLSGVRLKNSSGNLAVRNSGDSADAQITASQLNNTGSDVLIGSAHILTMSQNASQSAALQVIWPAAKATDGQVMAQKASTASGVLEFELVSAASTAACDKCDTTSLAFNSSGTVNMFSTGAADIIDRVEVIVDTAFDGTTPSMSVGISGTVSKYMASSQVDLTTVGVYEVHPGKTAQGVEALVATFTAGGGASAGAARVLVYFNTPS